MQVYFKASNTICTFLVALKDKDTIEEFGRTFGDRLREHLRAPSPIHHHSQATGHPVDVECFTIVDREAHRFTRTIKEAMFICIHDLSFKRNVGKYQLPHIRDELLQDTKSLHLRWPGVTTSPKWARPLLHLSNIKGCSHFHQIGKYGPSTPLGCQFTPFAPLSTSAHYAQLVESGVSRYFNYLVFPPYTWWSHLSMGAVKAHL